MKKSPGKHNFDPVLSITERRTAVWGRKKRGKRIFEKLEISC